MRLRCARPTKIHRHRLHSINDDDRLYKRHTHTLVNAHSIRRKVSKFNWYVHFAAHFHLTLCMSLAFLCNLCDATCANLIQFSHSKCNELNIFMFHNILVDCVSILMLRSQTKHRWRWRSGRRKRGLLSLLICAYMKVLSEWKCPRGY